MRIVMYLARSLYIFISFVDGFKKIILPFTKFNLFVWLFIYLFVFCFLFSSFLITLLKREVSGDITLFLRLKNFYPCNFRKLLHLRLAKADSSPLQHAWQRKAMNREKKMVVIFFILPARSQVLAGWAMKMVIFDTSVKTTFTVNREPLLMGIRN